VSQGNQASGEGKEGEGAHNGYGCGGEASVPVAAAACGSSLDLKGNGGGGRGELHTRYKGVEIQKKVKGRGELIWSPRRRCACCLWSPRRHSSRRPCAPPRPQGRPYRRTPARDPSATPQWPRSASCYSAAVSAPSSRRSPCSGAWWEVGSLSGSGSEATERRGPREAARCERGGQG
jgi:hypothetical protein